MSKLETRASFDYPYQRVTCRLNANNGSAGLALRSAAVCAGRRPIGIRAVALQEGVGILPVSGVLVTQPINPDFSWG